MDSLELAARIDGIVRNAGGVPHGVDPFRDGVQYAGTEKKPGGKDFRFWVHLDSPANVRFINYHLGGEARTVFLHGGGKDWTSEERAAWAAQRARREKEDLDRREDRARLAQWIFSNAPHCRGHAYLARKHVQAVPRLRVARDGRLLVPAFRAADKAVRTLQFIGADGAKRFLAGGEKKGCFFPLVGDRAGPLLLCEGLATGISLHEATGYSVAVCFDAGNLLPAGLELRRMFPRRSLVFAADNDLEGADYEGRPRNAGVEKANAAAAATGGRLSVPPSWDGRGTDFNDLLNHLKGFPRG